MENRKIMVEVTEEEYEKIKAGVLEKDIPTYEDVKKDLLENLSDEDAKKIFEKHQNIIIDNILDDVLIGEIINRTKERSKVDTIHVREAASAQDFVLMKGTLEHLKKTDYARWDNPVIISDDTFDWQLKIFDAREQL